MTVIDMWWCILHSSNNTHFTLTNERLQGMTCFRTWSHSLWGCFLMLYQTISLNKSELDHAMAGIKSRTVARVRAMATVRAMARIRAMARP